MTSPCIPLRSPALCCLSLPAASLLSSWSTAPSFTLFVALPCRLPPSLRATSRPPLPITVSAGSLFPLPCLLSSGILLLLRSASAVASVYCLPSTPLCFWWFGVSENIKKLVVSFFGVLVVFVCFLGKGIPLDLFSVAWGGCGYWLPSRPSFLRKML